MNKLRFITTTDKQAESQQQTHIQMINIHDYRQTCIVDQLTVQLMPHLDLVSLDCGVLLILVSLDCGVLLEALDLKLLSLQ